jgi:hypothetical protein
MKSEKIEYNISSRQSKEWYPKEKSVEFFLHKEYMNYRTLNPKTIYTLLGMHGEHSTKASRWSTVAGMHR